MAETISAVYQMKRMTREQWKTSQYIPREGEAVCESDTGFVKVGDGIHRFPDLRYLTGPQGERGIQGIQGPPGRDGVVTFENLSQAQRNSLRAIEGNVASKDLLDLEVLMDNQGNVEQTGLEANVVQLEKEEL